MSGGISATTVAAVAAASSAAIGAASAISAGQQARAQANQQAKAAEYNAAVSQNQATMAYAAGVERESVRRRQAAQQLSQQRAAFGASGIDANSGSALEVQLQSTRNAELDALQTRYEGVLAGQNYEQNAAMGTYQADTLRQSGSAAARNSYLSASASLLGGLANASSIGRSPSNPAPVVERGTSIGRLG